jgi:hypothetical protein
MSAAPSCVTLSNPPDVTVATAGLDDDHVDSAVTSCMVPFDSVAFAVNWLVWPTTGTVPVTVMDDVLGAVGLL